MLWFRLYLTSLDEEQICYTLKGHILPMKFVQKPVPQHLMGHHVLQNKCCHNLVYTSPLYKPKRSQKHLWSQDKKQHGRNSCKLPPNWSEPTLCGSHYLKLEDGCDESKDRVARLIREFHRCHVGQLKAEAVLAGSSPHPIFIYMFASQVQQLTKPWGPGAQVPIPKVNRIHDQVCSLLRLKSLSAWFHCLVPDEEVETRKHHLSCEFWPKNDRCPPEF